MTDLMTIYREDGSSSLRKTWGSWAAGLRVEVGISKSFLGLHRLLERHAGGMSECRRASPGAFKSVANEVVRKVPEFGVDLSAMPDGPRSRSSTGAPTGLRPSASIVIASPLPCPPTSA